MHRYLFVFCVFCAFSLASCKKDDDTQAWVSTSNNYSLAEAFIQETFKIIDEASKGQPEIYKLASLDCAAITIEADTPGVFPKTLIIDYGLVNCIGTDGRKRRGVIKAVFNERYSITGTVASISFENFFINNYKVVSTNLKLTNTSTLIQTQHHLNFPNLRFINPSGQSININGSRTFLLITGQDTQGADDDVFKISGTFTGSDFTGSSITATITDPLHLNYECRSITSGLLNLTSSFDGVFNYGEGECDDKATVTIDGRIFYINLE